MFFWNSIAFSRSQWILAVWSLVPQPFLNPVWTYGSSWFMYCWSLAWKILSITLLACEMSTIVQSLDILWHCLSLGLEWKLTFSIRSMNPCNLNVVKQEMARLNTSQQTRVQNGVLGCNLKNNRMILVCFQGKSLNMMVTQVYAASHILAHREYCFGWDYDFFF